MCRVEANSSVSVLQERSESEISVHAYSVPSQFIRRFAWHSINKKLIYSIK